ncbi:hypothetical protein BJV78DRAFT_1246855 [Lactifluus subvellereus]|nr:hypothetical protein BJV78DRAFT_1246855 [Lactifluus subvellereus]
MGSAERNMSFSYSSVLLTIDAAFCQVVVQRLVVCHGGKSWLHTHVLGGILVLVRVCSFHPSTFLTGVDACNMVPPIYNSAAFPQDIGPSTLPHPVGWSGTPKDGPHI